MKQQELIPHLFRSEFGKITTVLCKLFGIQHLQVAEDIASEVFLSALETWPYKGIPENPTGWLYVAAKNKAKNYLARDQVFVQKVSKGIAKASADPQIFEIDLSEQNITDSQLQTLFTLCHPSIPPESQIGLSLRIICGFGIEEIASAFLTSKETINKRLYRAKEKLRSEKIKIEFPEGDEVNKRLDVVLTTLYLLFNEGYYSESQDVIVREDLCKEAIRLTYLLTENEKTGQPHVNALLSLMCFHASRLDARKKQDGKIVLYHEQDEKLWNRELIDKGIFFLHRASHGAKLSKYHLEASIAYWHTIKADSSEKWENILQLYNQLLMIQYSPVAALNRTYALSKVKGKAEAIIEAEKLSLFDNHYYFTLLGDLYQDIDNAKAREHLQKAFSLARSNTDRQTIQMKIDQLAGAPAG